MNTEDQVREEVVDAREVRTEKTGDRLRGGLNLLIWMSVVLAVLLVGNLVRSWALQDNMEQVEAAANETTEIAGEAKVSADAALTELRDAISAIEESNAGEPDLQNQAIIDALEAIARIEAHLCGGACPETG